MELKIKHYLLYAGLFLSMQSLAQVPSEDEKEVAAAVETLRKGIVDANRAILESITAPELVYGHSNGKVQNKSAFVDEIVSGIPLDYVTVELSEQTIRLAGNVAIIRHIFSAQTKAGEKEGSLKIGNTLIWQKQHGKWKLLARQAYKL